MPVCAICDRPGACSISIRTSSTIVAGLETLDGPHALAEILAKIGADRTIFSLDLVNGRPRIATPGAWKSDDPIELAHQAIEQGARRLLLLDLARVGTGRGLGTLSLLSQIRAAHPEVQVSAGGGIAGIAEVLELKRLRRLRRARCLGVP